MLNRKKHTVDEEEAGMTVRQRLRQKRELEEKRKFGLAPLAVDEVSGNEISPNVPQLISQAPWYYGASGPTLDHQRLKSAETMDRLQDKHDKVVVLGKAKAYTAGACGNCGSSTHKTSECYKPRKRVGARFSGKVSAVDMQVERTEKTYAQKRERYAMGAGVDLLQQAAQEEDKGAEEARAGGRHEANGEAVKKHPRLQDVFATQTAVTGGGAEIKELPKHLHNLDDDGALFDPKTGSMRGNPNAADPTRTFQGDLQRYRTGDYYTYLDMQLRFLNGESKSIVDFELDEQLQRQKRQGQQRKEEGNRNDNGASTEEETARERLVRSLYGDSALASAESSLRMKKAIASVAAAAAAAAPSPASSSSTPMAVPFPRTLSATRNGHACVYGSYFDRDGFRWGYKCCKRLGKDAAACQSTPREIATAAKAEEQSLGGAS
ncbi:pre-mRNA-processing factor SLU7 [Trypanosoma conorhini]|uniref:Pre-mRNA-splicing factor SLU7 n=1 Tax=Trypanosoma conorhini TaxID=83891 RepID=A0A422QA21_9TRYP|nr:pre-mRNA-processing factor SLU7 [Trypanosoma conorhini]RNF26816.1 pre-mRNA-processing factor SLU7 [Trypanosoma conorhini]